MSSSFRLGQVGVRLLMTTPPRPDYWWPYPYPLRHIIQANFWLLVGHMICLYKPSKFPKKEILFQSGFWATYVSHQNFLFWKFSWDIPSQCGSHASHQNFLFWTNVGPTAVHTIHQIFLFQNLHQMWVPQPPHHPIKISFFSRSHDLKKSFVGPKYAYISHQNFLFWKVTWPSQKPFWQSHMTCLHNPSKFPFWVSHPHGPLPLCRSHQSPNPIWTLLMRSIPWGPP